MTDQNKRIIEHFPQWEREKSARASSRRKQDKRQEEEGVTNRKKRKLGRIKVKGNNIETNAQERGRLKLQN